MGVNKMKKILLSLSVVAAVAVVVVGATTAFFSDTETSTGNTFTAGAIDLKIDNESYYNSLVNGPATWDLRDLIVEKFFNFVDVKPGDDGEDTISLHVNNNASWLCVDVTLTSDNDNTCTEPEGEDEMLNLDGSGSTSPSCSTDGELAEDVEFIWWADDGDNVLEEGENTLSGSGGNLGALTVNGAPAMVTLADSNDNIWTETPDTPIPANEQNPRYIAKAWCFGDIAELPLPQDGETNDWSPATNNNNDLVVDEKDGGFTCSGASSANNVSQTDSFTADISFYAVQSRNNPDFTCQAPRGDE